MGIELLGINKKNSDVAERKHSETIWGPALVAFILSLIILFAVVMISSYVYRELDSVDAESAEFHKQLSITIESLYLVTLLVFGIISGYYIICKWNKVKNEKK